MEQFIEMPELARFYGIIIRMFFEVDTHNMPHFALRKYK